MIMSGCMDFQMNVAHKIARKQHDNPRSSKSIVDKGLFTPPGKTLSFVLSLTLSLYSMEVAMKDIPERYATCGPQHRIIEEVCTPPASPLMDEGTFEDLMSETSQLPVTCCYATQLPNSSLVGVEFGLKQNSLSDVSGDAGVVSWSGEVTEAGPTSTCSTPNEDDAIVTLFGPSFGDRLQHIDVDTVDEVLSQCGSPSGHRLDIPSSPGSILSSPESILSSPETFLASPESILASPESILLSPESIPDKSNVFFSKSDLDLYLLKPKCKTQDESYEKIKASIGSSYGGDEIPEATNVDDELISCLNETYSECIREELKLKIRLRRLKCGQDDPSLEHNTPKTTISYEAIQRRNELREKNREYAKMSRERASVRQLQLEKDYDRLYKEGQRLTDHVDRLKSQLCELKELLEMHINTKNCKVEEPRARMPLILVKSHKQCFKAMVRSMPKLQRSFTRILGL